MDSKVIFIDHPFYAVKNPSNNLRIYKRHKEEIGITFSAKTKNIIEKKLRNIYVAFMNTAEMRRKLNHQC